MESELEECKEELEDGKLEEELEVEDEQEGEFEINLKAV